MQAIVMDWLAKKDWDTSQLIDWLQGYDLPLFGDSDEPYLWLLRGVPEADERYPAETEFASRVAALIDERPDVERRGKRPDQLLFNLFMLSAGLNCADQLADPLVSVFERAQLKGKWRGIDLRTALKTALIANQKDSRLLPVWEDALCDGDERFLTIDEYDFVDAARLMPPAEDRRGTPAMEAIGKALMRIAIRLENDSERRVKYRSLIQKVEYTYPGRRSWPKDLLSVANVNQWRNWAIECLPSLHIKVFSNDQDYGSFTWRYLVSCIPSSLDYEVVRKLCRDQVFELRMSDKTAEFLENIAPTFERNRLGNPYPSDSSVLGVVITSIIETGIDPKSASIAKVLRRIGGYDKTELDNVIEPIADRVSEGEISKDNVLHFARASDLPAQTVSYIKKRFAA